MLDTILYTQVINQSRPLTSDSYYHRERWMGNKHTKNQKMSVLKGTKQRDAWSSQTCDVGGWVGSDSLNFTQ